MCSSPVTFGGGTAMEKFVGRVAHRLGVEGARVLPPPPHTRLGLRGLVALALLELLEAVVGHGPSVPGSD